MRETANARSVSRASVPYLEMKRRQFHRAALSSLRATAMADLRGDCDASLRNWARYQQAHDLIDQAGIDLRSRSIGGLSRIVARVLRTPLLPTGDVA